MTSGNDNDRRIHVQTAYPVISFKPLSPHWNGLPFMVPSGLCDTQRDWCAVQVIIQPDRAPRILIWRAPARCCLLAAHAGWPRAVMSVLESCLVRRSFLPFPQMALPGCVWQVHTSLQLFPCSSCRAARSAHASTWSLLSFSRASQQALDSAEHIAGFKCEYCQTAWT